MKKVYLGIFCRIAQLQNNPILKDTWAFNIAMRILFPLKRGMSLRGHVS